MTEPRLLFVADIETNRKSMCQYKIINSKREYIGRLEKIRVGRWMSWCLFLEQDCYVSAGCLDEIRDKIRSLNTNVIKVKRGK